jgi:hypothetical protein
MSAWENWLVAAGIFLGIGVGGSLLASLLYDWARPAVRMTFPQITAAVTSQAPRSDSSPPGRHRSCLILLAWIIGSEERRA